MNKKIINDTCDITAQTKKNTLRLFFWTGAWVLATAGAAFGPRFLWDFNTLPTVLGVLVHIGIGFGMIRLFRQYLLRLDELQRKIQLDAMALSLGVGVVFGVSYEMLEDIKLITFEPEISHLHLLMCLTYFIGIILGNRRYQ
jgi:predicted membrane protein